jgi:Flp pilus assembly protein TadG
MATVIGPIGGDSSGGLSRILERVMRCPSLRRSRGQAIVETALLLPILMLLVMGSADLGRVFYYSIAVTNAVREAARQGTYYDPLTNTNPYATYDQVLAAARNDVPSDVTLSWPSSSPSHCLTGSPASWRVYYPTQPNTGHVFVCFDGQESPPPASATQTVQVTILYNFAPVTPLADVVGAGFVQVEASTTMRVQKQ